MSWWNTFSAGSNCWTFDQLTALLCQHSHTTGTNDNEHQWSCIPVSTHYTSWRELASMEGQQEQHPDGVRSLNHQDRCQSSTARRHHLGWHDDTSCACPFWERDSSSVTISEVSSLFPPQLKRDFWQLFFFFASESNPDLRTEDLYAVRIVNPLLIFDSGLFKSNWRGKTCIRTEMLEHFHIYKVCHWCILAAASKWFMVVAE